MSNGNEILNDLELEKRIKTMSDRELAEFNVRQTFEISGRCVRHNKRIKALEDGNKAASSITGGITGAVTAIVISIMNYFVNR